MYYGVVILALDVTLLPGNIPSAVKLRTSNCCTTFLRISHRNIPSHL